MTNTKVLILKFKFSFKSILIFNKSKIFSIIIILLLILLLKITYLFTNHILKNLSVLQHKPNITNINISHINKHLLN